MAELDARLAAEGMGLIAGAQEIFHLNGLYNADDTISWATAEASLPDTECMHEAMYTMWRETGEWWDYDVEVDSFFDTIKQYDADGDNRLSLADLEAMADEYGVRAYLQYRIDEYGFEDPDTLLQPEMTC